MIGDLLLESWFQQQVFSFLPARQLFNIQTVCKQLGASVKWVKVQVDADSVELHDDIERTSENVREPSQGNEQPEVWGQSQSNAVVWCVLSHLPPHAHSIAVKATWKDQGWGNSKGGIYIVQGDRKPPDENEYHEAEMLDKLVLAHASPAPQNWGNVLLLAPVLEGSQLKVCLRRGMGGGHSLFTKDLEIWALCHNVGE
mmetsp:Transcript_8158/g.13164  ORF Transcript_8158/g.13164 Transcript_8158/m.13164 type:complete len:199 (-) Transcript_8158:170-766(-)|eukprot:CAMPEP_0203761360 /NCGR_PEP_ID=MMETSP0098-20131031/14466_1 /ASSEMBLY_ACC=CAM_ASM_000208 /TAXON_ID=96639 /ORGANISM=" , Strain NY0313808BC1" /LENGTH=198 /DNA_ID=CAMNT_0050655323 /DNA_START=395 /DNA_END=991 /DNA_ORIENTATION=-